MVAEALPSLEERLEAVACTHGFAAFGIAHADAAPQTAARLDQWLAEGRHGDMIWMESRAAQRGSPKGLWPEVKSVIALGMSYAPAHDPLALADHPGRGRISVYAQGGDYHDVVKRALKAVARWLVAEAKDAEVKVFVDTAPVMEKPLSAAAGLGWQGKHTNLVSQDANSASAHKAASATIGDSSLASLSSSGTKRASPLFPAATPAAAVRRAKTRVRRRRFLRPIGSMRGAAFPISQSSMTGRSRSICGAGSAIGFMAATIVSPSVRGTNSPTPRMRIAPSCRAPNWSRPRFPICSRSTMTVSGRFLRGRRSKGSGAGAWCAMPRSRPETAVMHALFRSSKGWRAMNRRWSLMRLYGRSPSWRPDVSAGATGRSCSRRRCGRRACARRHALQRG
jgi:hypothetical protein